MNVVRAWALVLALVATCAGAAEARADACVVRTEGAGFVPVHVPVAGGPPIVVRVRDSEFVTVDVPTRTARVAAAHVASSLALDGQIPAQDVPWTWVPGASIGGVLVVEPDAGWDIERAWSDARGVHVTVVSPGVRIADAVVTCESLALAARWPVAEEGVVADAPSVASTRWVPLVRTLRMRRAPSGAADLTLVLSDPASFVLELVREERGLALVRQAGPGYVLEGWVARRALGLWRDVPRSFSGRSASVPRICTPEHDPDLWAGPGAVLVGTEVADRPGGSVWARVAASHAFYVSHRVASDWVAIIDTPGIELTPSACVAPRAWVPARAVTFGVVRGPSLPLGRAPPSNAMMRVSPPAPVRE